MADERALMFTTAQRKYKGFSLIELMVAISILAIMGTVAVPNLVDLVRRNQVQAQSNELFSLIQFARAQAVTRRTSYEVIAVNDGAQWVAQRLNSADDPRRRVIDMNPNIDINSTLAEGTGLVFRPNGSSTQATTFISCRDDKFEDAIVIFVRNSGVAQQFQRGKKNLTDDLESCTP